MSGKAIKHKRRLLRLLESLDLANFNFLVDKYPSLNLNKQFSRLQWPDSHFYIKHWAPKPVGGVRYAARVKCKLMHGKGWSVVVPDQVYLKRGTDWLWIQPFGFGANVCIKTDTDSICQLHVDISAGESINVRFMGRPPLCAYGDGSHLYECELFGPSELVDYATGRAFFNSQSIPYLQLYHHTTNEIKPKILASQHFRAGDYNIQGTTKRLLNVGYAYFTPLDE